jgi:hypothetical protein
VSNLRYLNAQGVKIINAHPLYCTYSAFNLCEYYDFIISEGYFNEVYWSAIQNIHSLNVFKLPTKLKATAMAELDKCINKYKVSGYDMSALVNIRSQLELTLNETKGYVTRLQFETWLHTIEVEQLTDKQYSFDQLWPGLIAEFP